MVRLDLPFPPPLSACFTNRVGVSKRTGKQFVSRVTTKRYEDWQKAAQRQIRDQQPERLKGEVAVYVRLRAPDQRARDAGNCDKAVLDAIVAAGIIPDDSNRHVRRLTFEWHDHGPECVVLIQPLEPAQGALI